ncbi:hypothetical protein BS333_06955 [Vibrio azureus]|uniref:Uncharacterized protein n=1 Tax=Vibrio azureus NBRC 104587 TaxID=1219077 RepID=U3ASF8_9VIBR|nr:hypothetical protein [Vibrio azureus]AUI86145.1 hypothetical protein BS333_06955 [Vibrio azureus]GAD76690.1 hypothetical protein VAZ01S_050_00020 [Vibrio azureus NBRC 104587]
MALTIRDTHKHEYMLAELKEQTGTNTMSKALIQGGYDALKYKELYLEEKKKTQALREQLLNKNEAVNSFLDSLDNLNRVFKR